MPVEKMAPVAVTAVCGNGESEPTGSTFGSGLCGALCSANFQSTPSTSGLMASADSVRHESGVDAIDAASGDSCAIAADSETVFNVESVSNLDAPADLGWAIAPGAAIKFDGSDPDQAALLTPIITIAPGGDPLGGVNSFATGLFLSQNAPMTPAVVDTLPRFDVAVATADAVAPSTMFGALSVSPGNDFAAAGGSAVVSGALPSGFDDVDKAVQGDQARAAFGVTGAGIKIGIISDAFNAISGDLSTAVAEGAIGAYTILQDDPSAGTDEGLAMAEIVHSIAPGAEVYFWSGDFGEANFAQGIETLAQDGCQIVIDDESYLTEPFYQEGAPISAAIDSVVQNYGVTYLTAAGNDGPQSFYEADFNSSTSFTTNLPILSHRGNETVTAFNFGTASSPTAYEAITVPGGYSGDYITIDLQWDQPFQSISGTGSAYSLQFYLFNSNHQLVNNPGYGPVEGYGASGSNNGDEVGLDPVQWNAFLDPSAPGNYTYYLAIVENGGTIPVNQGQFKVIISDDAGQPIAFSGSGAGVGTGSVYGHALDANAITVGAAAYYETPAFGVSPPQIEPYSSSGPGEFLIDANGSQLATPVVADKVDISAPDGGPTALPPNEGLSPFYGTSAATPAAAGIAALMLQENPSLTPAQIATILAESAIPMANSDVSGAGLVQATTAVELAEAAVPDTVVTSGQIRDVSSGQTSNGIVVMTGGTLEILSGGKVNDAVDSGVVVVESGGLASGTVVSSGGTQQVYGSASGTTVSSGGVEIVISGGTDSGTMINANGLQQVWVGGVADGAQVSSGGTQQVYGSASRTTVSSGGLEIVISGGTDSSTVISGLQQVWVGGVADGARVSSGGTQQVYGSASGTTVSSGGLEIVISGGTDSGTTISANGLEQVWIGGLATGAQVKSGGTQQDYGTATGTVVSSGGLEIVTGGTDSGTVVNGGGLQQVWVGGLAKGAQIKSGGTEQVYGSASGTTLSNGGLEIVISGGTDSAAVISVGGLQQVWVGGAAEGVQVSSGGTEQVYGSASGTVVSSGGLEVVIGGGADSGTAVDAGGSQQVWAGGVGSGAHVNSGGVEQVWGTASGAVVSSGGTQYVYSGGSAVATTVSSGGHEQVFSGGTVNGATISGGELELDSGGTAGTSTITFAGGGTFKLDGTGTYGMLVAGFTSSSAVIDLSSIEFATASKSFVEAGNNLSGTLTLTDGTNSASIILMGNYIAGAASFTLSQDAGTGTLVVDPPLATDASPIGLVAQNHI